MTALEQNLLSMLEATAYDLWQAALMADRMGYRALYDRMKAPQVGDTVMEITSFRRWREPNGKNLPDRMGYGKLIDKRPNKDENLTEWIIQTPDGRSCKWSNAIIVAVPLGKFDFYA